MKIYTLCYVRENGKTLMIHRNKKENDVHEGKWNGLGGKHEEGETPEECAVREVYEESGLRVKNPVLKGIITAPKFYEDHDALVFVYVMRNFEGELIESSEGDLEWIADEKLTELNLWEADREFIPWLNEPGVFSLKVMYEEGRLKSSSVDWHR